MVSLDISCHVRCLGDWTKQLYDFFASNPSQPTQEYSLREDTEQTCPLPAPDTSGTNILRRFDHIGGGKTLTGLSDPSSMKVPAGDRSPLPASLSIIKEEDRLQGIESADESDVEQKIGRPLLDRRPDASTKRKSFANSKLKKVRVD